MQGDLLYSLIGAGIVAIIGFALIMKAGSKLGWLIVAGACVWTWFSLQPVIAKARRSSAAEAGGSGYYRK